jgi:hypothetical protein
MGMPSAGGRPGGLTALAVLNFVIAGIYLLAILGAVAVLGLINAAAKGASEGKASVHDLPNIGLVYLSILLLLVTSALLIASGVGYLNQKKFLGKGLGTAYGVLGLVHAGIGVAMGGFGIATIVNLVYPVLTLVLLHTVFKEDFPY